MSVELTDTAFFPQTTDQCGPAALATVLGATGVMVTPDQLTSAVYIPDRNGSLQVELLAATRRYGRLPYPVGLDVLSILGEVQAGNPVLVLQNLGTKRFPTWHYAVVVGYLPDEDRFVLRSGKHRRHLMSTAGFLRTWRRANSWGIVVLTPGERPDGRDAATFVQAAADLEAVGQTEAAATAYEAATGQWPRHPIAWLGRGNTQYELGNLKSAEQAYSEALSLDGGNVVALNNLALVQADLGRIGDALETIGNAMSLSAPDDAVHAVIERTHSEILARRELGPDVTL